MPLRINRNKIKNKEKQNKSERSPCHYNFEHLHLLDSVCLRSLDGLHQGSTKRVKGHTTQLRLCEDKDYL